VAEQPLKIVNGTISDFATTDVALVGGVLAKTSTGVNAPGNDLTVIGGAATPAGTGAGGAARITGGAAGTTAAALAGGNVIITGGATSGTGAGALPGGVVLETTRTATSTAAVADGPVLTLTQPALTVGVFAGASDPSAGSGVVANAGSLYLRQSGGVGSMYLKTGAANTAWSVDVSPVLEGSTLRVDAVNGSDTTGTRGDFARPFKTITAALNASSANDLIQVGPGTFVEAPFTMPVNRAICGSFPLRTKIQYTATAACTFVTMSAGSVFRSIKIELLSDTTARTPLIGVLFPGTVNNAYLQDAHVIVDNSNVTSGLTDVTGVSFTTTGDYASEDAIFDVAIDVRSRFTGAKRGIVNSGVGNHVHAAEVSCTLVSPGSVNAINIEAVDGIFAISSSRVHVSPVAAGNANVSAKLNTPSSLRIGSVDLEESSCNGRAFVSSGQLGTMVFSDIGSQNGTLYLQAGGDSTGATESVARFRIARACIVQTLSCQVQTAPIGGSVVYTVRKNSAPMTLTATITTGTLVATDLNNAVEFAANDYISIQRVGTGSASNAQVTIEMSAW
jgi:hypothetical protein